MFYKLKFLVFFSISIFLYSCGIKKKNESKNSILSNKTVFKSKQIDSIKNGIESSLFDFSLKENNNLKELNFKAEDINIKVYAFNNGYSYLYQNNSYYPLEFNYTYDAEFESSIKRIRFFIAPKSKYIYAIFPSYTEEFMTFHLICLKEEQVEDLGLLTLSVNTFEKYMKLKGEEKFLIFAKDKITLSCYKNEVKIDFDVININEKVNSREITNEDLNLIKDIRKL